MEWTREACTVETRGTRAIYKEGSVYAINSGKDTRGSGQARWEAANEEIERISQANTPEPLQPACRLIITTPEVSEASGLDGVITRCLSAQA
jgi:hypothetical protein